MDMEEGFRVTAIIISAVCFFPQALCVYKSKSYGDLSQSTFMMLFVSALLWTVWAGIENHMLFLFVSLIQTMSILFIILFMKHKDIPIAIQFIERPSAQAPDFALR